MKRLVTGLMALALFAMVAPESRAQEDDKTIRIEIRDGRILVNGKDVDRAEGNRLTITGDDGEEVSVLLGDNGHSVWVGNMDGPLRAFDRLRDNAFFSDDAEPFVWEGFGQGPRRAYSINGDLLRGSRELAELAGRLSFEMDPELRSMERRIQELAREVRRAAEADRAELEAELDELLAEAFEAKMAREQEQAQRMSERLGELEARMAERREAREEIIQRRKRQLLGERDLLDW
ncbi:MAG: hypothetical protein JJ896_07770 [Rhodothermales bacterium]|nr:hypothetical protein [Rhodothermales bacterium]MBO6779537.1 hypothetical protein [Rhodothermales bacterium]